MSLFSSCECWKPNSSIREVFGINFNYWDISKALASMTLMSIFTSWKKYCYSTKVEIQTKTLFSGKLQNVWSDSISQLILECTDIMNLFSPFLHFRFLLSIWCKSLYYSPVCYTPPASTSPVPWLQVWVTTQHSNSDLQVEKPRTDEMAQEVGYLATKCDNLSLIPSPHMVQREELYPITSTGKWWHKCKRVYTQINSMKLKLKNLKNFS